MDMKLDDALSFDCKDVLLQARAEDDSGDELCRIELLQDALDAAEALKKEIVRIRSTGVIYKIGW